MHTEKYQNGLDYSLQEEGADWHVNHAETSRIQFQFKEKVLLCTVIIFLEVKVLQLLTNISNATEQKQNTNINRFSMRI